MTNEPFPVDLGDPADIRAKMPEIRRLYGQKRQELKALTEQVEVLGRLLGEKSAGKSAAAGPRSRAGKNAPGQDRAVRALEQAATPMGPTSLYRYMVENGMDVPKDSNALGANLWSAWKAGRIMKAPNGVYTTLDSTGRTEHDQPLTDYVEAERKGFPVPQTLMPVEGNPGR